MVGAESDLEDFALKMLWRVLGSLALLLVVAVIAGIVYFSLTFPKVGAAAKIQITATPEMKQRGEYLFNHVAACVHCHSTRDITRYTAPIIPGTEGKGGLDFAAFEKMSGTLQSANITPAAIGDWTDGELLRAITEGVNKDGKALFPIMPYPNYGVLDRNDMEAIVVYLRTLAPIDNVVPETNLPIPLNIIVKMIPQPAHLQARPDTTDLVTHGKYLVTMASCGDCHTQRIKGEVVAGMEFAGGMEFDLPFGVVRSANITPDSVTGIGSWTRERFIDKFRMYSPENYVAPEVGVEGANTVMPWIPFSGMSEYDLGAIYTYLRTLTPVAYQVERVSLKPN